MADVDMKGPELEGLDEEKVQGVENYPIDSLLIRSETRSVVDVVRRIQRNVFILDPEFQRDFLWKESLQSRLVESILMRIPLPVFYIAETKTGDLIVVDGLQRLTSLSRFHSGLLTLDLPKNPDLNGLKFGSLPQRLKDRFEDGQLVFYIVDPKVPDRVRLDIFERVNSGQPLTLQQMRNAIYSGHATRLLKDLATASEFTSATDGALSTDEHRKRMDDREAVNRTLAFMLVGWRDFIVRRLAYDDFLGATLATINERSAKDDGWLLRLRSSFLRSMRSNALVFGRHAFRKFLLSEKRKRPLNLALMDVFGSALAGYTEERVAPHAERLRQGAASLLEDELFLSAISRGTLHFENVRIRHSKVAEMTTEILGDPTTSDFLV